MLAPGPTPLFPPLATEVGMARARLAQLVRLAGGHCRRDTLWKRLFLLEPPGPDRLRLGGRLALAELEELLEAVHAKSIADIDPQLDCFLSMTVSWYQSLIKVLLSRFPQSCRHFQSPDLGTQYLVSPIGPTLHLTPQNHSGSSGLANKLCLTLSSCCSRTIMIA